MTEFWKGPFLERVAAAWCAVMHDSPMWPMHGKYECRTCGRQYRVPWDEGKRPRLTLQPIVRETAKAAVRRAAA